MTWHRSFRASCAVAFAMTLSLAVAARQTEPMLPATAPSTQPFADLLHGTYVGTVVDDDETVPCTTRFKAYRGKVTGEYTVRDGNAAYKGTLKDFTIVNAGTRVCRFRWHDKHGVGFLTVQVNPDGRSFAGSWGQEVVQDELIWTGERTEPTSRPASESSQDGRGEVQPK